MCYGYLKLGSVSVLKELFRVEKYRCGAEVLSGVANTWSERCDQINRFGRLVSITNV